MHELMELKEKLCKELEEYGTKELSAGTHDVVDKLSHAIKNLDKIIVDYNECTKGFACNMVSTGKYAIMSNKAPKLQKELESRGIKCLTPDVTELKEGGGYIRCVSLWLS